MNSLCSILLGWALWTALLAMSLAISVAPTPTRSPQAPSAAKQNGKVENESFSPAAVATGRLLFRQACAFCHGTYAGGGESGPDLTRSKLVAEDSGGNAIGPVLRNGRIEKGMPRFEYSDEQIAALVAFIHSQRNDTLSKKGGRKGVDAADLQTGNVEAGRQFFYGAGGCSSCHSPTGDLSKIASRFEGLKLEEQMLYPRHAKSSVAVTLASGQTIIGTLVYLDEFTVGLQDPSGVYRSWKTGDVQYKVDAPVDAHAELLPKYTDADIHNLMAYLQTLR
jgi:cytochrome c oxidase cbb3-type subunit III